MTQNKPDTIPLFSGLQSAQNAKFGLSDNYCFNDMQLARDGGYTGMRPPEHGGLPAGMSAKVLNDYQLYQQGKIECTPELMKFLNMQVAPTRTVSVGMDATVGAEAAIPIFNAACSGRPHAAQAVVNWDDEDDDFATSGDYYDPEGDALQDAWIAMAEGIPLTPAQRTLLESRGIPITEPSPEASGGRTMRKQLPYKFTKRGQEEAAARQRVADQALVDAMQGTWYVD